MDEIFEALWKLADHFGYDLTRREGADDPDYGREDTVSDVWPERCKNCLSDEHTTRDHYHSLIARMAAEWPR